jgi:hypothetical protein
MKFAWKAKAGSGENLWIELMISFDQLTRATFGAGA